MRSATIHGIGIITKLYFVLFAAFKESIATDSGDAADELAVSQGNQLITQSFNTSTGLTDKHSAASYGSFAAIGYWCELSEVFEKSPCARTGRRYC